MSPDPILVTGCSSGIGHATALRLAQRGHTVYATARQPETLVDLAAAGAQTLALDVTDEASMSAAVEAVISEHGAVGALVNNAGYSLSAAMETLSMDDLRRQFETNVFGLVRMCQLVLPSMRAKRTGRIVNLSSMGGKLTFPGGGAYHATKHAVESLSDALRFEVSGFGIGVTVIEPGLIRSGFAATAGEGIADDHGGPYAEFNRAVARSTHDAYEKGALARLAGKPDDVAGAIESALLAERAPIRVRVTPSAHLLIGVRRLMTDRIWDRFLATQYPRPR